MERHIERREFFRKLALLILIITLAKSSFNFLRYNILAGRAELVLNGKVIENFFLNKNLAFAPFDADIVVVVPEGKIRFAHSNCPDKDCINAGFIQNKGESIECSHNKALIRITRDVKLPFIANIELPF